MNVRNAMRSILAVAVIALLATFASASNVSSTELGFSVTAPVPMTASEPVTLKNQNGDTFTNVRYTGVASNRDAFYLSVATYPFAVVQEDLGRATEALRKAVDGTVINSEDIKVSGQPALMSAISSTSSGKELRFLTLVTFKGNRAYILMFATDPTVTSDMDGVKAFFRTLTIN
jgi:hypothetical protein